MTARGFLQQALITLAVIALVSAVQKRVPMVAQLTAGEPLL